MITWESLSSDSRQHGDQINYQVCPECMDAKWHFYINTGTGGYKCFKCEAAGYLPVEGTFNRPKPREAVWEEISLPPNGPPGAWARSYLLQRGIGRTTFEQLGLREWTGQGRILIPYTNSEGAVIYWQARDFTGRQEPRYLGAPDVRRPLFIAPGDGRIVLVEGVFDAVRVNQVGPTAVAMGGKTLAEHMVKPLEHVVRAGSQVYVCLDGDALKNALELQCFVQAQLGIDTIMACPDFGEDPGSMPLEKLEGLFS